MNTNTLKEDLEVLKEIIIDFNLVKDSKEGNAYLVMAKANILEAVENLERYIEFQNRERVI